MPDLAAAQRLNESAAHRNVGLVVETRPDELDPAELKELRRLGATKIQLGIQSLDDWILKLNRRGYTVREALSAVALCRVAGFKIVLHWMPNLLGATPESDAKDFARLWSADRGGLGFCPDEIKIYPTQLVKNAGLYQEWIEGRYRPYDTENADRADRRRQANHPAVLPREPRDPRYPVASRRRREQANQPANGYSAACPGKRADVRVHPLPRDQGTASQPGRADAPGHSLSGCLRRGTFPLLRSEELV